jgi:hypothetical protein
MNWFSGTRPGMGHPAGTRRFRDRSIHKGPVRAANMGNPDRSLVETAVTKPPGSRRVALMGTGFNTVRDPDGTHLLLLSGITVAHKG